MYTSDISTILLSIVKIHSQITIISYSLCVQQMASQLILNSCWQSESGVSHKLWHPFFNLQIDVGTAYEVTQYMFDYTLFSYANPPSHLACPITMFMWLCISHLNSFFFNEEASDFVKLWTSVLNLLPLHLWKTVPTSTTVLNYFVVSQNLLVALGNIWDTDIACKYCWVPHVSQLGQRIHT